MLAAIAALVVLWFVFWSVDFERDRTTALSAHLMLAERVRVERSPFSLAGGDGGFAALPIPSRYDRVVGQRIIRDGVTVWTGAVSWQDPSRDVDVFASPDERFVTLESRIKQEPLAVRNIAAGTEISIPEPDSVRAREHYGYAPRFFGWSADSRYLFMVTLEADYSDNVDERWFRYIWRVDVRNGRVALGRRCEDRFPFDPDRGPDWSRTACADTARPS